MKNATFAGPTSWARAEWTNHSFFTSTVNNQAISQTGSRLTSDNFVFVFPHNDRVGDHNLLVTTVQGSAEEVAWWGSVGRYSVGRYDSQQGQRQRQALQASNQIQVLHSN